MFRGCGNIVMNEINLYIDESGNLGTGMGRYFLICALEIDSSIKSTIVKRAGRIICRFKEKNNIPKNTELKGFRLNTEKRNELIDKILYKGVKVRYIVLDLKQTTMLLTKPDDKNACFNYLIQLIVKNIVENYPAIEKVNLFLDNRSVKIGNRLSLKPYLYNKLVLEQLESKHNVKRIDFEINYLESESCYLIQCSDIISNSLFKKYNTNNNYYYKKIKQNIIFESKFPSKNFGK